MQHEMQNDIKQLLQKVKSLKQDIYDVDDKVVLLDKKLEMLIQLLAKK